MTHRTSHAPMIRRLSPGPACRDGTRRGRGFTLVEVLVAAALSTMVFAGIFAVFGLGNRSRGVTATARGLQTAMLIQEYLTNDLARLAVRGAPFIFDPAKPGRLAFYVIDPAATAEGSVGVRAVRYSLDSPGSQLMREYAVEVAPVGQSPLTSAAFLPFRSATGPMVRVTLVVGRTPEEPAGPPLVHTFLARPTLSPLGPDLVVQPLSDFRNREEPPRNVKLPVPPDELSSSPGR